jgi:hypothetical protein
MRQLATEALRLTAEAIALTIEAGLLMVALLLARINRRLRPR